MFCFFFGDYIDFFSILYGCGFQVPDEACKTARPKTQELCNAHECPKWITMEWSGVSFIFDLLYRSIKKNRKYFNYELHSILL